MIILKIFKNKIKTNKYLNNTSMKSDEENKILQSRVHKY